MTLAITWKWGSHIEGLLYRNLIKCIVGLCIDIISALAASQLLRAEAAGQLAGSGSGFATSSGSDSDWTRGYTNAVQVCRQARRCPCDATWGGAYTKPRGQPRNRLSTNRCKFTGELCSWTRFSLEEILVLAGTTGAGGMAPPTSTRISARLKCSGTHFTRENRHRTVTPSAHNAFFSLFAAHNAFPAAGGFPRAAVAPVTPGIRAGASPANLSPTTQNDQFVA